MNNSNLKQLSKLMDDKFDEKLAPIKETLSGHGRILSQHGKMLESHGKMLESHGKMLESHGKMLESHNIVLKSIGKTLESHGKMLKSLKKDQNTMLGMLDGEQMKQRKRIIRIEDHLGLTSPTS